MVKLAPRFFADAAAQMRGHAGVEATRLSVKIRQRQGAIDLKTTDGKTTLTAKITSQSEFKMLERIITEYVVASTAAAIAASGEEAKGKKGKKGGRK